MWSLVVTIIFAQQPGHIGSASMLSVPGFESQQACLSAGEGWLKANEKALRASSLSNVSALCVKNELPPALQQKPSRPSF